MRKLWLMLGLLFPPVLHADGPFQFFSVTPCRLVDTRGATGLLGGPSLAATSTRNFPVTTSPANCGIPTTAKAVAFNVVVIGPGGTGHLRMWPYNTAIPNVSVINFNAGEPAIANGAIVPLAADPSFQVSVYNGSGGSADLVLDINGYFQ